MFFSDIFFKNVFFYIFLFFTFFKTFFLIRSRNFRREKSQKFVKIPKTTQNSEILGQEFSKKTNTSFLYSSNYSLGVNLFFDLNKKLAKLISSHKDYELKISETHHTEKLDKPSGTAITIAEDIINNSKYLSWTFEKNNTSEIEIESLRKANVPGTHSVTYSSEIDSIEIKHSAHNRKGFALGAVVAAEWIIDKKGVFNMSDVIKDPNLNF